MPSKQLTIYVSCDTLYCSFAFFILEDFVEQAELKPEFNPSVPHLKQRRGRILEICWFGPWFYTWDSLGLMHEGVLNKITKTNCGIARSRPEPSSFPCGPFCISWFLQIEPLTILIKWKQVFGVVCTSFGIGELMLFNL